MKKLSWLTIRFLLLIGSISLSTFIHAEGNSNGHITGGASASDTRGGQTLASVLKTRDSCFARLAANIAQQYARQNKLHFDRSINLSSHGSDSATLLSTNCLHCDLHQSGMDALQGARYNDDSFVNGLYVKNTFDPTVNEFMAIHGLESADEFNRNGYTLLHLPLNKSDVVKTRDQNGHVISAVPPGNIQKRAEQLNKITEFKDVRIGWANAFYSWDASPIKGGTSRRHFLIIEQRPDGAIVVKVQKSKDADWNWQEDAATESRSQATPFTYLEAGRLVKTSRNWYQGGKFQISKFLVSDLKAVLPVGQPALVELKVPATKGDRGTSIPETQIKLDPKDYQECLEHKTRTQDLSLTPKTNTNISSSAAHEAQTQNPNPSCPRLQDWQKSKQKSIDPILRRQLKEKIAQEISQDYLSGHNINADTTCLQMSADSEELWATFESTLAATTLHQLRVVAEQQPKGPLSRFFENFDKAYPRGSKPLIHILPPSTKDSSKLEAGFDRANESIFLNPSNANQQKTKLMHELGHKRDPNLTEDAFLTRNEDLKEQKDKIIALAKSTDPKQLPPDQQAIIRRWLLGCLGQGLIAEYRAWLVNLTLYRDCLKGGLCAPDSEYENIIRDVCQNTNPNLSMAQKVFLHFDKDFYDPKEAPFDSELIQNALASLRSELRSFKQPIPLGREFEYILAGAPKELFSCSETAKSHELTH